MSTKSSKGKELVPRESKGESTSVWKFGTIKTDFAAKRGAAGSRFNPHVDLGGIVVKVHDAYLNGHRKPARGEVTKQLVKAPSKAQQVGQGIKGLHKPKEAHSFKLDPDVYAGLKQLADRENRSVNNLAETLLWNAVKAELG